MPLCPAAAVPQFCDKGTHYALRRCVPRADGGDLSYSNMSFWQSPSLCPNTAWIMPKGTLTGGGCKRTRTHCTHCTHCKHCTLALNRRHVREGAHARMHARTHARIARTHCTHALHTRTQARTHASAHARTRSTADAYEKAQRAGATCTRRTAAAACGDGCALPPWARWSSPPAGRPRTAPGSTRRRAARASHRGAGLSSAAVSTAEWAGNGRAYPRNGRAYQLHTDHDRNRR